MADRGGDRRASIAIVGSAFVVIAAILVIVLLAVVPLPDFEELDPGIAEGSVAFVDEGDCVNIVDLVLDDVRELTCRYEFPESLTWSRRGVEITVFSGGPEPIRVTIDPLSGEELEVTNLDPDEFPPRPGDPSSIRRSRNGDSTIIGPDGTAVLTLEGPERYGIETAATNPGEAWIAFVDSIGRLAVFEIGGDVTYLAAEDARSFPAPVWEP